MKRVVIALVLSIVAAACATDGGPYPSLALRPVEKGSFDEPVRPHAAATPDAALDATLASRGAELDRLVAGFDGAAAAASHATARPGAGVVGSETWLDAQAALARLDDWRSQTSALAVTIEGLGSARATQLQPAYPALDALAARVGAETERQAAAVATLQRRVPAA